MSNVIRLGDYITEISEKTTVNNQHMVLTSSQEGIVSQDDYFNKQVASKDNTGYKIIRRGQFTYRAMSDTGRFYINRLTDYDIGIVSPAYPVFELRTNGQILPEYLQEYFHSEHFQNAITLSSTGSTRVSLKLAKIADLRIDIPTLPKQQCAVQAISHVNHLISMQNSSAAKLDQLVKSRFVEMFGTYPNNPMKWETGRIRDIVADVRYGSSRPAVEGGKYSYLRMNNITYGGELDLSDTKHIDVPENELEKCIVRRGDVLFNRTNSKELVGKTCVYNRNEMMVLAGFIIRVRVTERVLPEFLSAFLNTDFSKQMLLGMCKAAIGQANINAQELQDIGLYLPPVELQHQFVHFKAEVDKSKFRIQKSLSTSRKLWTMAQIDAIMNMDFSTQRSL